MQNAMTGFTERDMLQDLLMTEKNIVKTYGGFIVETSCENLRGVLNANIKDSVCDQFEIFNSMRDRNYYPVKEAESTDVQQAKTKFTDVKKQMSS